MAYILLYDDKGVVTNWLIFCKMKLVTLHFVVISNYNDKSKKIQKSNKLVLYFVKWWFDI